MKQIKHQTNNTVLDTLKLGDKNLIHYIEEKPDMLPSVIDYLDNDQKNKLLIHFCKLGDLTRVKYLVSYGADIHVNKEYPLYGAIIHGHLDIVKYLVSNGADIHVGQEYPLYLAIINSRLEIVKYLVSQGANIHADNERPICTAVINEHFDIARYLISKGANASGLHPYHQHCLEIALNK